jgi:hypothetical protein
MIINVMVRANFSYGVYPNKLNCPAWKSRGRNDQEEQVLGIWDLFFKDSPRKHKRDGKGDQHS